MLRLIKTFESGTAIKIPNCGEHLSVPEKPCVNRFHAEVFNNKQRRIRFAMATKGSSTANIEFRIHQAFVSHPPSVQREVRLCRLSLVATRAEVQCKRRIGAKSEGLRRSTAAFGRATSQQREIRETPETARRTQARLHTHHE